jgi:hypothetical protein
LSLQRFLLVDVDDIFVGERGTRLKKDDVMVNIIYRILIDFTLGLFSNVRLVYQLCCLP